MSKVKPHPVVDAELIEALPIAVCVCDLDGVIVRYNRKAAELWGQPMPICSTAALTGSTDRTEFFFHKIAPPWSKRYVLGPPFVTLSFR
jgi:hypothetical protein